jgi:hypothetical protein
MIGLRQKLLTFYGKKLSGSEGINFGPPRGTIGKPTFWRVDRA